ncbi:TonB-dependent siderophore receptor [Acinetobacter sp. ANC 4470]|uniref:catecholate siderophore receptor Fiu n=1 Tax=Acinetobacter sp. ANC 4470 TaxID=1977881 RepID=UPI000A345C09|nr:catecholate siderophore receptor Fiu [Acinetobacter sp. ANC 4470]OTG68560.1 TonB-dependent siderophore receptor [Acinetobacter sp. ANC 4470]
MTQIKSRKHNRTAPLVALAASLPLMTHAATLPKDETTVLPKITVQSEVENKYKANKVSSAKYTQPLVDTPQTISVIKKELLKEQGAASLTEALRNTPGITLQLGENGNTSAGDSFQMRGFDTKNSIYLDGIRDIGAISRDIYNLEQIEVVKGPSGAEAGRGGAGGYINLVSKLPHLENSQEVSATYNTAKHTRLTADINQALSAGTAIRLNVMGQEGGIDGRDYAENNSYAIAPSIAFGLDSDTRFYLYSQHIRQRNIPDGGIPTIGMKGFYYNNTDAKLTQAQRDIINTAVNAAEPVDRETFYGNINDHEDVDADIFTAKVESDLNENVKLTNISRFGKTEMDRVLTGVNALVISNLATPKDPNSWSVVRTRQGVDQENKILTNQTTLNIKAKTGFVEHDIVAGLELLREEQFNNTLNVQTPGQAMPTIPAANLYSPDPYQTLPDLVYTGAYANGKTDTAAAYLFDTLKFGERFQLNGGVRVDYYDTEADALTVATNATTLAVTKTPSNLSTHGTLVSWKLGSVFKPTSASSIYTSYAKSFTPPGTASVLSNTASSANDPTAKPQETHHYEVGTKWTFNEDKLILTAAAYHTENENQITQDPITLQYIPEGKTTVKGLELGAVGQLTRAWNVSAGVAFMDSEQENQQTYNATTNVWTENNAVRWSPDWTATLWTTYSIAGFRAGLGARYVDEQKRSITPNSTATTNMPVIPSYVVFDALLGYTLNNKASLNLNIYNLADKEYISTLNNSGARLVMGQPRSAALTFNYKF